MGQAGQYHTTHSIGIQFARDLQYWLRRPFCILLRYYIIRTARVCAEIKWKKKAVRFSNELLSRSAAGCCCKIPSAPALHSVQSRFQHPMEIQIALRHISPPVARAAHRGFQISNFCQLANESMCPKRKREVLNFVHTLFKCASGASIFCL